jgi:hypothetical protein
MSVTGNNRRLQMRRKSILAASITFAFILPALFIGFAQGQRKITPRLAYPADVSGAWGDPHVGLVVDTTAGRQIALDTLAQSATALEKTYTQTYHLVGFKDQPLYFGNTTEPDEYAIWLDNLTSSGGGSCTDNALAGLLEMASQAPSGINPTTNVLLQTDATPKGGTAAYLYTISRMLKRHVRVETVINGWCPNAEIDKRPLNYLSLATGGRFWETDGQNFYTDTLISRFLLSSGDLVTSVRGQVSPGNPFIEPIKIDSTISTIDAEGTTCCPCLTCTLQAASPDHMIPASPTMLDFTLLDPEGNIIDGSFQGFSEFSSAQHHLLHLDAAAEIITGTWGMQIGGDGEYIIDVFANSSIHMAYLGPRSLPAGHSTNVNALIVDQSGFVGVMNASFSLVSYNGDTSLPIDLFDDGAHGDGAAGDGLYGGTITPPPGLWRVVLNGMLDDGSAFQRIDPAPLRVRPFQLPEPPESAVLQGHTRSVNFMLTNDLAGEGSLTTTYDVGVFSEQGWVITSTVPASVTLAPGETQVFQVQVTVPLSASIGTVEETTFVASAQDDLLQSAEAVAETTVVDELRLHLPVVVRTSDP